MHYVPTFVDVEIVVNHLTRMSGGHVCVAGLDRDGQHVRPVLPHGRLPRDLVADYGGPFSVGAVVELDHAMPRPTSPEVEDHVFDPDRARRVRSADKDKLWRFLGELASGSLIEIFGDTLDRDGLTASMPLETGRASLGVYRPAQRPTLDRSFGRLRVVVNDRELGTMSLALTDLRLYDLESDSVDERRVALLEDRLRRREVLLSVGVGRPWARDGDVPKHWLQVNNVHLDDNPLWPG